MAVRAHNIALRKLGKEFGFTAATLNESADVGDFLSTHMVKLHARRMLSPATISAGLSFEQLDASYLQADRRRRELSIDACVALRFPGRTKSSHRRASRFSDPRRVSGAIPTLTLCSGITHADQIYHELEWVTEEDLR